MNSIFITLMLWTLVVAATIIAGAAIFAVICHFIKRD